MGRRRKGRSVEMKLLIPEKIYLEFEKMLTNNFTTRPVYGARSQLITALIQKWVEARKLKPLTSTTTTPIDQKQTENPDE